MASYPLGVRQFWTVLVVAGFVSLFSRDADAITCISSCSDVICGYIAGDELIASGSIVEEGDGSSSIRIERVFVGDLGETWTEGRHVLAMNGPYSKPKDADKVLLFVRDENNYRVLWSKGDVLICPGDPPITFESAVNIAQSPSCKRAAKSAGMLVGYCGDGWIEDEAAGGLPGADTGCTSEGGTSSLLALLMVAAGVARSPKNSSRLS